MSILEGLLFCVWQQDQKVYAIGFGHLHDKVHHQNRYEYIFIAFNRYSALL